MPNSSEKKRLLSAGAHADVMGRHFRVESTDGDGGGSIKFDWPGVRLDFRPVKGTKELSLRLQGGWSMFGYSVCETACDGALIESNQQNAEQKILSGRFLGTKDRVLASSLDPSKTYQVCIWKRDDPCGVCTIVGLLVDEDATVVEPANNPSEGHRRHIEFVGDSDTVGFGNMGNKSGILQYIIFQMPFTPFIPKLQHATDASKSWAAHVAKGLGAKYSIVAWSGIGAQYSIGMSDSMTDLYPQTLATRSSNKGQLEPVDAVLVYIGQNDQETLGLLGSDSKLEAVLEKLLRLIRAYRKAPTPIIAVVPTLDAAVACTGSERERRKTCEKQNRVYKSVVEKLGGSQASYYLIEAQHQPQIRLNSREDFGLCLHWNAAAHEKWANGVLEKVRNILDEAVVPDN